MYQQIKPENMIKKYIVIAFLTLVSMSVFAQKYSDIVVQYLSEFSDTSYLYRDVVISNIDDKSWPALGVMREEIAFYYTYEHVTEQILVLVSKECNYSSIVYTEYYIYDVFQNLKYYIYESGETYIVNVVNQEGVERVSTSGIDYLSDNYFIDSEYEFLEDEIRKKSNFMISYLDVLWGVPNYANQKEYIAKKFKEINSMNNLVERKLGNVTAYYNDGELVKMIQKGEIIKEYTSKMKNYSLLILLHLKLNQNIVCISTEGKHSFMVKNHCKKMTMNSLIMK